MAQPRRVTDCDASQKAPRWHEREPPGAERVRDVPETPACVMRVFHGRVPVLVLALRILRDQITILAKRKNGLETTFHHNEIPPILNLCELTRNFPSCNLSIPPGVSFTVLYPAGGCFPEHLT